MEKLVVYSQLFDEKWRANSGAISRLGNDRSKVRDASKSRANSIRGDSSSGDQMWSYEKEEIARSAAYLLDDDPPRFGSIEEVGRATL